MRFTIAILALIVALAPRAEASGPETLTHNGILADGSGVAVPDGTYDLTFILWTTPTGGFFPPWAETQTNVQTVNGQYRVVLGSVVPLTANLSGPLWLSTSIDGGPEVGARVPLASSAYALGLALPFSGTADAAAPALDIENTGTGAAIEVGGAMNIGSSSEAGLMQMWMGGGSLMVEADDAAGFGGRIVTYDESGFATAWFGREISPTPGTTGELAVLRSQTQSGFRVIGSKNGSGNPRVDITGALRSAVIDLTQSADPSVQLPSSSIAPTEIFNEPGVASAAADGPLTVNYGPTVLLLRTITVPWPGYVVAIASAEVRAALAHLSTGAAFSISTTTAEGRTVRFSSNIAAYNMPVTVQDVFLVPSGSTQFKFIGATNHILGLTAQVEDLQMTLLYVPTAYGTTQASTSPGEVAP